MHGTVAIVLVANFSATTARDHDDAEIAKQITAEIAASSHPRDLGEIADYAGDHRDHGGRAAGGEGGEGGEG